jgi:hypothetical protein
VSRRSVNCWGGFLPSSAGADDEIKIVIWLRCIFASWIVNFADFFHDTLKHDNAEEASDSTAVCLFLSMGTLSSGKGHLPKERILRSVGRLGPVEEVCGRTGAGRFSIFSLTLRTDARTLLQFRSSGSSNRHKSLWLARSARYSAPSRVASFSETIKPCNFRYYEALSLTLNLPILTFRGVPTVSPRQAIGKASPPSIRKSWLIRCVDLRASSCTSAHNLRILIPLRKSTIL